MSNKVLVFIGEGIRFDQNLVSSSVKKIDGVSDVKEGEMIGAVLSCLYTKDRESTILRLTDDLETITIDGLYDISLSLALTLNQVIEHPLYAIDMNYSFHIRLDSIKTVSDFKKAISNSTYC